MAEIDEETTRLNRVVTEVLDFARPLRFEFTDASLNDICRDSAAAAMAGDPAPGIVLALDPAMPHMTTDVEHLRTALVNVLTNARHAVGEKPGLGSTGPPGADAIRLETSTPDSGQVRISVTDRGGGITSAHLPAIFEPYFTTRRAGTGLGLPIARNIIEGMGGRIRVESVAGTGTLIDIDLPVQTAGAHA